MKWSTITERKIGGIPVVYIGLVVALVVLYAAIRLPKATPTEDDIEGDAEEELATDAEVNIVQGTQQPVFMANPVTAPVTNVTENTNETWGMRARDYLAANGATPTQATTAITKYLNQETLSITEGALRDKAIKHLGFPPEGIIATSTMGYTGPASAQGTAPTTHTVKGKSDDTFRELARLYYGLDNADAVNLLNAKNPTLTEPLRVGARVSIPKFTRPRYYKSTKAKNNLYEIAKVNATTAAAITELNPGMKFPVSAGTRVRVK